MKVLLIIGIVLCGLRVLLDIYNLTQDEDTDLLLHLYFLAVFIVGLVVLWNSSTLLEALL